MYLICEKICFYSINIIASGIIRKEFIVKVFKIFLCSRGETQNGVVINSRRCDNGAKLNYLTVIQLRATQNLGALPKIPVDDYIIFFQNEREYCEK